jgi:hypothetical protein
MAGIGVLSLFNPIGDITWPGSIFFLVVGLLLAAFSWKCIMPGAPVAKEGKEPARQPTPRQHLSPQELAAHRSLRETRIRQKIHDIGNEAFPDPPSVSWTIQGITHEGEDVAFVEVKPTPSDPIGWDYLKFALDFGSSDEPRIAACYGLRGDRWSSVFHVSGYDRSELDRLLFHGSGRPMPESDRESWIRQNINHIGRDAYPDYPDVKWTFHGVVHQGGYTFVEAEPTPADPIGWPRVRFVLRCEADAQPILAGGYGLEQAGWQRIFATSDTPTDWDQLCN